jgi:hypothetical protein
LARTRRPRPPCDERPEEESAAHHAAGGSSPAREGRASPAAAALGAAFALRAVAVGACGSSGGRKSFVAHDRSGAVFVEWTRTGDDVTGSISATEITQPQTGVFSSATRPAGQVKQQTQTFTGTVRGDSVRLQIGSPWLASRINGRLDGDTLELSIPLDEGVRAVRLEPANPRDYDDAARKVRADVQRGAANARARRVREQRSARTQRRSGRVGGEGHRGRSMTMRLQQR